jgi:hypothetical protein
LKIKLDGVKARRKENIKKTYVGKRIILQWILERQAGMVRVEFI